MKSKEEIINRAKMIEMLREEGESLSKTIDYLWENPQEFEDEGNIFDEPDIELSDEDQLLFRFAFLAGIEYERAYPNGDGD